MDPTAEIRRSVKSEFERRRKKRRTGGEKEKSPSSHWRNSGDQQIYSSNLLHALRQVSRSSAHNVNTLPRTRAVREAADRVLATAARGRTRWSRAILLSHRRNLKIKSSVKRRQRKPPIRRVSSVEMKVGGSAAEAVVERKAKVLGRLVPGCRKLSFPSLLEETTDYIAALQMQVKAMSALAEILSATSSSGDRPSPSTEALSGSGGSSS